MTQRGFIFLMVVAVIASIVAGKLIVPYTAPGLERTVWFGVILAVVLYLAGMFAERRGWIRGKLDLTRRGRQQAAADKSDEAK